MRYVAVKGDCDDEDSTINNIDEDEDGVGLLLVIVMIAILILRGLV